MNFLRPSFHTLDLLPKHELPFGSDLIARIVIENRGAGDAHDVALTFAHNGLPLQLVSAKVTRDLAAEALQSVIGDPDDFSESGIEELAVDGGRALVPDLAPVSACVVFATFELTDAVNDGTPLSLQAHLHLEGDVFGSNVATVMVRSRADAHTSVTFEPCGRDRASVEILVDATGSDAMRDLCVTLPRPIGCELVASSLSAHRMVGGSATPVAVAPDSPVRLDTLAAGTGLRIEYEVAIVEPQPRGILELPPAIVTSSNAGVGASGTRAALVGSSQVGELEIVAGFGEPFSPRVTRHVSVSARNDGLVCSGPLSLAVSAPDGLRIVDGTQMAFVNGCGRRSDCWELPSLAARETGIFSFDLVADAPMMGAVGLVLTVQDLPDHGTTSTRTATLPIRVEGSAQLIVDVRGAGGSPVPQELAAGEVLSLDVIVKNVGTLPARAAALIVDGRTHELGDVAPSEVRTMNAEIHAPVRAEDGDVVAIAIATRVDGVVAECVAPRIVVRSSPRITRESVTFGPIDPQPLEPNRSAIVEIAATNGGSTIARGLVLGLEAYPAKAVRVPETVSLGDVAPGATGRTTFELRLLEALERDAPVRLRGLLRGANVAPLALTAQVETHSTVRITGSLTASAARGVDALGIDRLEVCEAALFTLDLQNVGDALARRVRVRAEAQPGLSFIAGSLLIGDRVAMFADDLFGRGVLLDGVAPDERVRLTWSMIAQPAGTTADVTAFVDVDGQDTAGEPSLMRVALALVARPSLVSPLRAPADAAMGREPATPADEFESTENTSRDAQTQSHVGDDAAAPAIDHVRNDVLPPDIPSVAEHGSWLSESEAPVPEAPQHQAIAVVDEPVETDESTDAAVSTSAPSLDAADHASDAADDETFDAAALANPVSEEKSESTVGTEESSAAPSTEPAISGMDVIATMRAPIVPDFPPICAELDLVFERLDRIGRLMKQAQQHELASHLFTLRALFPDRIVGCEAFPQLEAAREALKLVLDRLLLRMQMRRYVIDNADLESRASREALVDLVRAVVRPIRSQADIPDTTGGQLLAVTLDLQTLRTRVDELERAPLGTALPFLVTAHFLPDRGPSASISAVLREYRTAMLDALSLLDGSDTATFLTAIGRPAPLGLDHKLSRVLGELADVATELQGMRTPA